MSDARSIGTHDTRCIFKGKNGAPVDCSCGESFETEHHWHLHVRCCPGARPLPCCRGTPWYEGHAKESR